MEKPLGRSGKAEAGAGLTDSVWVDGLWERREDVLACIQEGYGRYLRSIALHILDSPADADECVNDTLLAAWNSIPPARPGDLRTYLGKLCRRRAIDRLRAEHAAKRGSGEAILSLEELADCLPEDPDGKTDEDYADAEAIRELLSGFLRELPEAERFIFVRRYWYMDPVSEICARTGYRESRVKMTLKRTRDKLSRRLREEGYFV